MRRSARRRRTSNAIAPQACSRSRWKPPPSTPLPHATGHSVVCLAHLTNELGGEGDFEKGAADGAEDALRVLEAILPRLNLARTPS